MSGKKGMLAMLVLCVAVGTANARLQPARPAPAKKDLRTEIKNAINKEIANHAKKAIQSLLEELKVSENAAELLREYLGLSEEDAKTVAALLDEGIDKALDALLDKLADQATEKGMQAVEKSLAKLERALPKRPGRPWNAAVAPRIKPRQVQPMMVLPGRLTVQPGKIGLLSVFCGKKTAGPPLVGDLMLACSEGIVVRSADDEEWIGLYEAIRKGYLDVRGTGSSSALLVHSRSANQLEIKVEKPTWAATDKDTLETARNHWNGDDKLFEVIQQAAVAIQRGPGSRAVFRFLRLAQIIVWARESGRVNLDDAIGQVEKLRDGFLAG